MNNQWFSKIAVWLVVAMVLFTVFRQFDTRATMGSGTIGYSDFLEQVRSNRIKSATIQEGAGGTEVDDVGGRRGGGDRLRVRKQVLLVEDHGVSP